eukprot:325103-Prorocentrum_minimum.AAC.2
MPAAAGAFTQLEWAVIRAGFTCEFQSVSQSDIRGTNVVLPTLRTPRIPRSKLELVGGSVGGKRGSEGRSMGRKGGKGGKWGR